MRVRTPCVGHGWGGGSGLGGGGGPGSSTQPLGECSIKLKDSEYR